MSYKFLRLLLSPVYKVWFHPKVIGLENVPKKGPVIIAGNHIHALDPSNIIVYNKREVHFLAKDKYYDKKMTKWFFQSMKCIKVKTGVKNTEATQAAVDVLKSGEVIGIFPEGTRNKTKELLQPFKFGAVSMARKADAVIVPFALSGKYQFRSKNLIARFGKPVNLNDLPIEEANQKLHDLVEDLLKQNLKETATVAKK